MHTSSYSEVLIVSVIKVPEKRYTFSAKRDRRGRKRGEQVPILVVVSLTSTLQKDLYMDYFLVTTDMLTAHIEHDQLTWYFGSLGFWFCQ